MTTKVTITNDGPGEVQVLPYHLENHGEMSYRNDNWVEKTVLKAGESITFHIWNQRHLEVKEVQPK